MYIQYIGFNVAASSRIYNFDVIDRAEEAREFTVTVQSEAFRSAHLKFQDGPDLCFERLEQELERETRELRAAAHLSIGKRDIEDYFEGHDPRVAEPGQTSDPERFSLNLAGCSSHR
jgi:hypothetical protein